MTDSEIEQIRAGAVRYLEKIGCRFLNRQILECLEKKGCHVDYPSSQVRVTPEVMKRLEETARRGASKSDEEEVLRRPLPTGEPMGHNYTCYYDWTEKKRRAATLNDIRNVVKAWHQLPEIPETGPCMTAQDVPTELEPIVSTVEVMKLTPKIRHCPEMILGSQLPYLEELETIMAGEQRQYRGSGCSVTRFTVDERAAGCLMAINKRNGVESWWINSCPVAGVTAPVTLAGAVTVGVAETMGGWLAGWGLNEDVILGAIPLSGMVDMRTGKVLFSTPETILIDSALYQFFYRFYGIRIGLCCGYTDADQPGLQAMNDKLLKSLAYGWFTDKIGGQTGSLSAGNIYSPTQQILDLELNRQTAQLARGIEVNAETLALADIERLAGKEDGIFLTEDHTLKHWRKELWIPELMIRAEPRAGADARPENYSLVERAERKWRDALAAYQPPALDKTALRAADKVVERARQELLAR